MSIQEEEWERQSRGYDDTNGARLCLDCIADGQLRANVGARATDVGEPCSGCDRLGSNVPAETVLSEMFRVVHLLYGDALNFLPIEGGQFAFDTTDGREVFDWEFADGLKEEAYSAIREFIRDDVSLARDADHSDMLEEWWRRLRHFLADGQSETVGESMDTQFLGAFQAFLGRNPRLLRVDPVGTRYWRVRALHAGRSLRDYDGANLMGSPPAAVASDSRFSRRGQPAFYGAASASTAVAEVFQGSGGTAVRASFLAVRNLTLLDLVDLPPTPNIYDVSQTELYLALRFLRQFAEDVSRPAPKATVGHYLPTQEVTQIVRALTSPVVDGIRYTSSQDGLPSVIIFAEPGQCVDPGVRTSSAILEYEPESLSEIPVT